MSFWIGSEARSDGTLSSCSGCTWISNQVSKVSNIIPVFYAYIIGFYGHANGLPDGNQAPNGPNLTTGGANLIRNNRAKIISMYSSYATQVHAVWGTQAAGLVAGRRLRPVHDLDADQPAQLRRARPAGRGHHLRDQGGDAQRGRRDQPLDLERQRRDQQLLAGDVGRELRHGVDQRRRQRQRLLHAGHDRDSSYNGATATYAYLHSITGRTILVDTSFGASATSDSWSDSGVANLNARIADGVVAINVTTPTSNYASNIAGETGLSTTCH